MAKFRRKRRPHRKRHASKRQLMARLRSRNFDPRMARPFTDTYRANMRYCTTLTFNPTLGQNTSHSFSMNSLFDPDRTGVGHQPMGFDQLAALYHRYLVLGAKITVVYQSNITEVTDQGVVGLTIHPTQTFTTSNEDLPGLVEQGKTVFKQLGIASGGTPRGTLSYKVSLKKEFGCKDLRDQIDEYGALTASNPTNEVFASLWAINNDDDASATPSFAAFVKIEYACLFIEPRLLQQS